MKKILIIFLFLFGFYFNVSAKEIIVDGKSYNASKDFEGLGYSYNSSTKILYLDGYHGGIIDYTDERFSICINGDNVINGEKNDIALNTYRVNIYGDGTLNIINGDIGIQADGLQIQSITVFIMASKIGIKANEYETYLANTKVVIENSKIGIYGTDSLFLQNSVVNLVDNEYGINGDNLSITLNKSKLYIKSNDYSLSEIKNINVVDSKAVFKSNLIALNDKYILERSGNIIFVSNDKENYFQEKEYHYYPIVKVATKEEIDNLVIDENDLIIDIDKSFITSDEENNKNLDEDDDDNDNDINEDIFNENQGNTDVFTKNEYTQNEYNYSEFDKIEIVNPQTVDNINNFIMMGLISIFLIITMLFFRRENE